MSGREKKPRHGPEWLNDIFKPNAGPFGPVIPCIGEGKIIVLTAEFGKIVRVPPETPAMEPSDDHVNTSESFDEGAVTENPVAMSVVSSQFKKTFDPSIPLE